MNCNPSVVRVRFLSLTDASATSTLLWRSMLDDEERSRADRCHLQCDHDAFIAAHALTRVVLSEATGAPRTSWRFIHGQYGKPAIVVGPGGQQLRFNMSHTRGLVACAISDSCDLGVDVEASDRATDLTLADRHFAPVEVAIIRSAPPHQQHRLFFRFWTLKEAFIKATGEGLSRSLASFSFTLDPIRIAFHSDHDELKRRDDPVHWQFAQCFVAPERILALAVRRLDAIDLPLDIQAMQVDDMTER
jgi:4'-phosphopantetheinyl transferase